MFCITIIVTAISYRFITFLNLFVQDCAKAWSKFDILYFINTYLNKKAWRLERFILIFLLEFVSSNSNVCVPTFISIISVIFLYIEISKYLFLNIDK